MATRAIVLQEQEQLNEEDREYVNTLNLDYPSREYEGIPPFLGLNSDGWSSYYVGISWLKNSVRPLVVHPKIHNIDFLNILSAALSNNVNPKYFEGAYSINLDSPLIEDETLNTVLSPLLIAHFISIMRILLEKGLKRNYIIREENLKNKVRGHIMPLRNLQENILRGHAEQTWCRFQEYTYDYPENRLLKRGLLASESYLLSLKAQNDTLLQLVRKLLFAFSNVSADITPTAVKSVRNDKLHGEYPEAIKLAKRILKRTDYSINKLSTQSNKVPEFAIDMSRIFEFHVLGFLQRHYKDKKILFQEDAGIMGRCDYIIPFCKLIVDAKYKLNFLNKDDNSLRTDIREVVGYSRSEKIRKIMDVPENEVVHCLIIYPVSPYEKVKEPEDEDILHSAESMKGVNNFFTLKIPIPEIQS